jgi:hypothetical protein
MSTDLLEKRLENLAVEIPDAGSVTARVLSRAPKPRSHRVRRFVSVGVATVLLSALVGYFVPAADTAVASTPVGDLLREAGLVGAKDRITWVGSVATSSGYRLKLVGAYADSTRTVLLLHSDPPTLANDAFSIELTDQFGRHYQLRSSVTNMLTGNASADFEPLAWPDAITGARITLRVSQVQALVRPYADGEPVQLKDVRGSWTLLATLGVDETTALPLPAPATLGPSHFQFTSASYSAATLAVEMDVTGVTMDELQRRIPDGLKGTPVFTADLIDPTGQSIGGQQSSGQSGTSQNIGPIHIRLLGYRFVGGGSYVIRIKYVGSGEFERVLKIP